MTQGLGAGEFGPTSGPYGAPPDDTGEAIGLPPAGLTITFGFGPSLFRRGGKDRFGLAGRQPAALRRLPHFPADNLDPARSDGDLCIQACADDPQVAVHAVRNLARIAFGRAAITWSQLGFGRTSSTSTSQTTARNLLGFKDGTMNLKAEEPDSIDQHVWVPAGADPKAGWLAGGSYLVARRINMTIETWDRQPLREQERVVGRTKAEGAPLSGGIGVQPAGFRPQGPRRRADGRDGRARPTGAPGQQRRGQDAAPRLQLRRRQQRVWVGSMPGCSSSPTSATRGPTSSRSRPRSASATASASIYSTPVPGCSPSLQASRRASTPARLCSPDRPFPARTRCSQGLLLLSPGVGSWSPGR